MTIRVEREGDSVWLTAPAYNKELAKQVPGARHDAKRQQWKLPLSWATCVIARGVFGARLEIGPELVEWATAERARIEQLMLVRAEAMEVDE